MGFRFYSPTNVEFGRGVSNKVGEKAKEIGCSKALVVTTEHGMDRWKNVIESLKSASINFEFFTKVQPNPKDYDCIKGAEFAKEKKVDLIIGLGGGSILDAAKTIAVLLTNGGRPQDWAWPKVLKRDITPLICIPTTSGTGSEVTRVAVVTDTQRRFKMTIADDRLSPKIALVDPELTKTLSQSLTASTGLDALSHAVESYTCKLANPLSDIFALEAIRLIVNNLKRAFLDGNDINARENMMLASTLGGLAITNSDVCAGHCMAEALGGFYDIPHGVACAIFLPVIFEYNIRGSPERHAKVAELFGVDPEGRTPIEVAEDGVKRIKEFIKELKIPSLRNVRGVNEKDFPTLAKYSAENSSASSNPVDLDEKGYLNLFKKSYYEK